MLKILLKSNCPKWNFVLVMSLENAFILQNNNNNNNKLFFSTTKKILILNSNRKKNPNTRPKCMHCPTHRHKNLCFFLTLNSNNQSHSYETPTPIDLKLHH